MTSWTARIDALLAEKPRGNQHDELSGWLDAKVSWNSARLALAAERMKEPHSFNCKWNMYNGTAAGLSGDGDCTCGKDRDLLRILEGR